MERPDAGTETRRFFRRVFACAPGDCFALDDLEELN